MIDFEYQMPYELTKWTVPLIKKDIYRKIEENGSKKLNINLRQLGDLDSAGIALLVQLKVKNNIILKDFPEKVRPHISIAGLETMFEKKPTE